MRSAVDPRGRQRVVRLARRVQIEAVREGNHLRMCSAIISRDLGGVLIRSRRCTHMISAMYSYDLGEFSRRCALTTPELNDWYSMLSPAAQQRLVEGQVTTR